MKSVFSPKEVYKLLKKITFIICVLVTFAFEEPVSDWWSKYLKGKNVELCKCKS